MLYQKLRMTGSSPRVRGTAAFSVQKSKVIRIIPACAGNRSTFSTAADVAAVHPRVCGEQESVPVLAALVLGSSPRVRGTEPSITIKTDSCRFIPACAGNSPSRTRRELSDSVHPRVCGEQGSIDQPLLRGDGSSPRVRGTAGTVIETGPARRFIPACAGNRAGSARAGRRLPVHPRVCGEQTEGTGDGQCQTGSSPRVRGTAILTG